MSTTEQPWKAWYRTARWQRLRARQLAAEPLCAYCLRVGNHIPATVCDHVERHRGDPDKFWGGPFQSLCAIHHSATKQKEEHGGKTQPIGRDGRPTDPNHPWNRR